MEVEIDFDDMGELALDFDDDFAEDSAAGVMEEEAKPDDLVEPGDLEGLRNRRARGA